MNKEERNNQTKNKKDSPLKWVVTIFIITFTVSGGISFFSNMVLETAHFVICLLLLLLIVMTGIIFDIVGVAVTAVDAKAIHGMVSRRVKGASEALYLIDHANRVSSVCNDVVGDICGIISGTATAVIVTRILMNISTTGLENNLVSLLLSGIVSGVTVGGKALGKILALNKSVDIVFATGRLIAFFKAPFSHKK